MLALLETPLVHYAMLFFMLDPVTLVILSHLAVYAMTRISPTGFFCVEAGSTVFARFKAGLPNLAVEVAAVFDCIFVTVSAWRTVVTPADVRSAGLVTKRASRAQ
jgi:hypothetical protein